MRILTAIGLLVWLVPGLRAETPEKSGGGKPNAKPTEESAASADDAKSVRSDAKQMEIGGKQIVYRATTGQLVLKTDDGKPRAKVFHVAYTLGQDEPDPKRPVMFCFNGGPGASAVWLHLGGIGPERIEMPGDGTTAPKPPARAVPNPFSILDVCDLVFVDPVSTGYSRALGETNPGDFHGVEEDVRSMGDFVRRWITDNDRWASPKFLLGESYGGIRVAGLSEFLQSEYGMSLNGVVFLSSLLDFQTLQPSSGNDLSYEVFLSTFAGTAHFHGKLEGDRDGVVAAAHEYAFGEYAAALREGNAISKEKLAAVAAKLESLTAVPASVWEINLLRLSSSQFRSELLKDQRKVIGRFDARVAWPDPNPSSPFPEYDPSFSLALGAFSTAMMEYLQDDLGWKEEMPYEILTSKVQPWKFNANNRVVNLGPRLATAMRDNPHLAILIMGGRTDLATPPDGIAYSIRHLVDLPQASLDRIHYTFYDGGHMFYLNPADLEKSRKDLVEFVSGAK